MSGLIVNSVVVIAVVGMATPATMALSIATITGNPLMRPLGITSEMLASGEVATDDPAVMVEVYLPKGDPSEDQARTLGERIRKTFLAKGAEAAVRVLHDPASASPYIIYRVKHYQFGPYAVAQSPNGVIPALVAYREVYGAAAPAQSGTATH